MIKEFHGKHYYTNLGNNYQLVIESQRILGELEEFKNETFGITKMPNGDWVIYSDSKLEGFRGPKYRAWEKFKREI